MKRIVLSQMTSFLFGLVTLLIFACDDPDPTVITAVDQGEMDAAVSSPDQGSDASPSPDALVGDVSRGQPLYDEFCGFCHAPDGSGYLADNANALSNPSFLATATDEFLRIAIVEGRPGTPMSPWGEKNGGPLDDQDVADIVSFVRAWQTDDNPSLDVHNQTVEGTAMRGRSAYNVFCKSCHGDDGEGTTAISLNNPWFHASASDGFIRHAIEKGRTGTAMPGYENQVSPQTIDDLVVLIRSWARPVDAPEPEPFEVDLTKAVVNEGGPNASFQLRDGRFASASDVKSAMDSGEAFILIDARPTADYLASHIAGAISIPFYAVDNFIDLLPRDLFIITYCGCPHAVSGQAADALLEAGFQDVAILDEGFYFWEEQGWPIEIGPPAN